VAAQGAISREAQCADHGRQKQLWSGAGDKSGV
jgi:hypothetical protein